MTIVNHPLVLDVGPPELTDQFSGPICNVELRNSTASDLFVVLSYYNNNITFHSDEKHENKSDSFIKIKVRHPEILANILLKGPPKFTVFRSWPRSPSGRVIPDELHLIHRGKTTPNGLPWGATIFDFYHFALDPSESSNIYSGSQLSEWSKAIGEEGLAKDEIEWASMEGMPRIIELYPPSMSVVIQEENIRARKEGWGISMPKDVALDSIDCAPDNVRVRPLCLLPMLTNPAIQPVDIQTFESPKPMASRSFQLSNRMSANPYSYPSTTEEDRSSRPVESPCHGQSKPLRQGTL